MSGVMSMSGVRSCIDAFASIQDLTPLPLTPLPYAYSGDNPNSSFR